MPIGAGEQTGDIEIRRFVDYSAILQAQGQVLGSRVSPNQRDGREDPVIQSPTVEKRDLRPPVSGNGGWNSIHESGIWVKRQHSYSAKNKRLSFLRLKRSENISAGKLGSLVVNAKSIWR